MKWIIALLVAATAGGALAHGPTPRKTDQSAMVAASANAVWLKLSEPCAIATWHPDVAECHSDAPRKRTLTLKNGGKLVEEIDEILPTEMTLSYRLGGESEMQALPVSSLSGHIKVLAEGDGARVTWKSRYYRAFTGNEPPPGQDDEAAQNAVDAYVNNGLEGLRKLLEAR